jgi:hypothetical protein
MDKEPTFEQVFRYRFSKNWALRNILVNYFVYWKGGGKDPRDSEANLQEVHEFIRANIVFKGDQYPGIGRMLMIEDIFEEKTSMKKKNKIDYHYPGLIPEKHLHLFETVVNEEYGLNEKLKSPKPYTVAQFMWNIYHNQDNDGGQGRKSGSAHMLEIAKQLFKEKFPQGLEISEKEAGIYGNYLLVKTNRYSWPLFFISGSRLINSDHETHRVYRAVKVTDPDTQFPTICGTYFGDNIKEFAREEGIQLLQISSLFKFFQWVDRKKREEITPEKIAPHLGMIPHQPEVPIPVGKATQEMEEQLRSR